MEFRPVLLLNFNVEEISDNPTRDVNAFLGGDFRTFLLVHGISTGSEMVHGAVGK